jgi:hypothetical protein
MRTEIRPVQRLQARAEKAPLSAQPANTRFLCSCVKMEGYFLSHLAGELSGDPAHPPDLGKTISIFDSSAAAITISQKV